MSKKDRLGKTKIVIEKLEQLFLDILWEDIPEDFKARADNILALLRAEEPEEAKPQGWENKISDELEGKSNQPEEPSKKRGGLIEWAKDHYWASLEPQRDLIIRHLKAFPEAEEPEPGEVTKAIRDYIADYIYAEAHGVPMRNKPRILERDLLKACKIIDHQAARIKELEEVYDHPNHDDPKQRYLYEIRNAIKLLREFSGREGGGENAFGVAVQLDQFYKRARVALKSE